MSHEEEAQYEAQLAELELKAGGVFAVPTLNGHKKRWQRKQELVRREIAAASDPQEKQRLERHLDELKRQELLLAEKLIARPTNA
ncbi:hypothetical protein [Aliterella atlantica]|uniref:Uncharacterized protein n=1 Tax=Aliterella atlantica CENA595 TaxID=1618023 RepID=A0A0D8ZQP7_9CYAN|nr:hypothetical protein [Aliterella atlantica]KJH69541.1 hypothetical protein UH38_23330 [Aliterella atlantica CENA595]